MDRCRDDVVEDESMDESKRYFAVLLSNRLIFTPLVTIQSMETYERVWLHSWPWSKGFRKEVKLTIVEVWTSLGVWGPYGAHVYRVYRVLDVLALYNGSYI
jgi:hypothetical protein